MRLLKPKKNITNTGSPGQQIAQPQTSYSVSMPVYGLVRLRKMWLGFMFFLGVVTQYLLAIYAPVVWNYIYELVLKFSPAL